MEEGRSPKKERTMGWIDAYILSAEFRLDSEIPVLCMIC